MLLGAFCTIAMAQVAASVRSSPSAVVYDLTSPFTYRGGARDEGAGIDLVSHGADVVGAAWVSEPFVPAEGGGFHATFDAYLQPEPDPGGGLVFAVQNAGSDALGADSGGLGYQGIGGSLAVELDVRLSDPEVDPDGNHLGIDLDGSIDSVATAPVPYPLEGPELHVQVDFADGMLTATLGSDDVVQVEVPATLPDGPLWVGFTASGTRKYARRIDAFGFVADVDPSAGTPTNTPTGTPTDTAGTMRDPDATHDTATAPPDLPRTFFCGCATADPRAAPVAGLALAGLVLRRRTPG